MMKMFFFEKVEGDKTLLDIIFGNKVNVFGFISNFKKRYDIIDYMLKYGMKNYYAISSEVVKLLFTNHDGEYLIDKYINNKEFISGILNKVPVELLLSYCKNKARFDILVNSNEKILLSNF